MEDKKVTQNQAGELTDDALESVNGGSQLREDFGGKPLSTVFLKSKKKSHDKTVYTPEKISNMAEDLVYRGNPGKASDLVYKETKDTFPQNHKI